MLDVKDAVRTAFGYFVELIGVSRAQDVLVEEVELVDERGSDYWMVTFSVPAPLLSPVNLLEKALRQPRDYKVIKIDAETGVVRGMKIRQIDAA